MKKVNLTIKSNVYKIIDESKINYLNDEHDYFNVYELTYLNLINEWAKHYYTPNNLLLNVLNVVSKCNCSTIIHYNLNDILKTSSINWKYYKKFKQISDSFKNPERFNFFILYFLNDIDLIIKKLIDLNFNKTTIDKILYDIENYDASSLQNSDDLESGCFIILNKNKINDFNTLEQKLDHEINHYFDRFDFDKNNDSFDDLTFDEKIEKIGYDAGYDLSNLFLKNEFINHMLNKVEFKEMCSNVCNILQFKLNDVNKLEWFNNKTTKRFIGSKEYKFLNQDLKNILFFGLICKIYSNKKWNELISSIEDQFDHKLSFINGIKSSIMKFIEKITW